MDGNMWPGPGELLTIAVIILIIGALLGSLVTCVLQ